MAAFFFDTSALVKRYVPEAGSTWVRSILDLAAGHRIDVARIVEVEVVSAVARRRRDGSLLPEDAASAVALFRDHLRRQYLVLKITRALLARAAQVAEAQALRAYDALQAGCGPRAEWTAR